MRRVVVSGLLVLLAVGPWAAAPAAAAPSAAATSLAAPAVSPTPAAQEGSPAAAAPSPAAATGAASPPAAQGSTGPGPSATDKGQAPPPPTVPIPGVGLGPGDTVPSWKDDRLRESGPGKFAAWPLRDARLWVPPSQGWLRFDRGVKSSTVKLSLTSSTGSDAGEMSRVTKGEKVTEVRFDFPVIDPGQYLLSYEVTAADGSVIAGDIGFEVMEHSIGIGGGNHRHNVGHVQGELWPEALARCLMLTGVAGLLAIWLYRRDTILTRWASRPFLAAGSAASLVGVSWYLLGEVHGMGETLADRLASAGFWSWSAVLVSSLLLLARPRPASSWMLGYAAVALSSVAYLSHVSYAANGVVLATLEAAALSSAAMGVALLAVRALSAVRPAPAFPRWLYAAAMPLPLAALAIPMLYVGMLQPVLDHAADLQVKGYAAVAYLVAWGISLLPLRGRGGLAVRLLAAAAALAAALVLTGLPPGAAGI